MTGVFSLIFLFVTTVALFAGESNCDIFRFKPERILTWKDTLPYPLYPIYMPLDFQDTLVIDSIKIISDPTIYPVKGIVYNHEGFLHHSLYYYIFIKAGDPIYWDSLSSPLYLGRSTFAGFTKPTVVLDSIRIKPSTPDTIKFDLVFFASFVNKTGPGSTARCRATDTLHIEALKSASGTTPVQQKSSFQTSRKSGLKKMISESGLLVINKDGKYFSPDGRVFSSRKPSMFSYKRSK